MLALAVGAALGCGGNTQRSRYDSFQPRDTTHSGGWQTLFAGNTLDGWHAYQQPRGVTTGWSVDSGAIRTEGTAKDLVSDQQYGSFELDLEWKVAPGSNSGVFIWANEGTAEIYENAPEMQVLDNVGAPDGKSPLTPVPETPWRGQWGQSG